MGLFARIRDWLVAEPQQFEFELIVALRDIYMADDTNSPLDLAITRQRAWKSYHTTRSVFVRCGDHVYEAELPRIARHFVWEWNNGRTVRPMDIPLQFQRVKGAEITQRLAGP